MWRTTLTTTATARWRHMVADVKCYIVSSNRVWQSAVYAWSTNNVFYRTVVPINNDYSDPMSVKTGLCRGMALVERNNRMSSYYLVLPKVCSLSRWEVLEQRGLHWGWRTIVTVLLLRVDVYAFFLTECFIKHYSWLEWISLTLGNDLQNCCLEWWIVSRQWIIIIEAETLSLSVKTRSREAFLKLITVH